MAINDFTERFSEILEYDLAEHDLVSRGEHIANVSYGALVTTINEFKPTLPKDVAIWLNENSDRLDSAITDLMAEQLNGVASPIQQFIMTDANALTKLYTGNLLGYHVDLDN